MHRRRWMLLVGSVTTAALSGCLDMIDDTDEDASGPGSEPQEETVEESDIRGEISIERGTDDECADAVEVTEYSHSLAGSELVVEGTVRNVADESPFVSDDPVTVSLSMDVERYGSGGSSPNEFTIGVGEDSTFELRYDIVPQDPPTRYELLVQPFCEDPDPVIINTESEGNLGTILTGDADVSIEVQNNGGTGQVAVTLWTFDEDRTLIDLETGTRTIGSDEIEQFSFSPSIDDGAEYFDVRATPVCDQPIEDNNPYWC